MILTKFSFESGDIESVRYNSLAIETIELGEHSLLVGKNASGKSIIIGALNNLIEILNESVPFVGKWEASWYDEELGETYKYVYKNYFNAIDKLRQESFWVNDKSLFERTDATGRIYSYELSDYENINPPSDKLILNIRRDEKRYPYLEKIAKWASGVHTLRFGHIHAPTYQEALNRRSLPGTKEKTFNEILAELDERILKNIVLDFNQLGYQLERLDVKKEGQENILFINEIGLKFPLRYYELSQGMFRSLSLLIYLHYLIEKGQAQLISIDDLCEGLDYDRATRLGKLLFKIMKEKGVQFIATSNDSFLMNVVDIKYWNVIYREGNAIKSFNYHNSRDKFEEFRTIGLNNFELFSSNFLQKK